MRGRLALPGNLPSPAAVSVTFHHGFSANLGGGEYPRAETLDLRLTPVAGVPVPYPSLRDALAALPAAGGAVEIADSGRYGEAGLLNLGIARVELPPLINQAEGKQVLARLTLRGNFLWAAGDPEAYLDGESFGVPRPGQKPSNLRLPSGDGRRGGDFEMWFWLTGPAPAVTLQSVTLPTSVTGGTTPKPKGMVTLSGTVPTGGVLVTLSSTDSAAASVPPSVTVPAGILPPPPSSM